MFAVPWLRPNSVLSLIAAFRIRINCSAQFVLVGSFQRTDCCARLRPLLSVKSSVVLTFTNFINPDAGILRFALYESILAIRKTLSLRSANSIKFSLLAKSSLNERLCLRNATASISARYSELSM